MLIQTTTRGGIDAVTRDGHVIDLMIESLGVGAVRICYHVYEEGDKPGHRLAQPSISIGSFYGSLL